MIQFHHFCLTSVLLAVVATRLSAFNKRAWNSQWSNVFNVVDDNDSSDPYCGKECPEGDADCNQAEGCMICDYHENKNTVTHKRTKICMTRSQDCGGPPSAPNGSLPQYLAIGDSITWGMFPHLKEDLASVADSHLVSKNAGPTGEGVQCVDVWVGEDLNRWDVISYNFGAWDTARQPSGAGGTPLTKYIDNLKNITDFLMKTKAGKMGRLVYVLTTPSANIKACCPANHSAGHDLGTLSCPSVIRAYNDAAIKLLSGYTPKIHIDNLWSWVNLHCCGTESCWYTLCDFQPEHGTCDARSL